VFRMHYNEVSRVDDAACFCLFAEVCKDIVRSFEVSIIGFRIRNTFIL